MIIAARGKILKNVEKLLLILSILALTVTLISAKKPWPLNNRCKRFLTLKFQE